MPFQLNLHEGIFLVQLARKATEVYLKEGNSIKAPENTPRKLRGIHGVFVTINEMEGKEKQLKGCIGIPFPTAPLVHAVIESSISSATQDPRFPRLELTELNTVVFEVSVLTPPQLIRVENPIEYVSKIKVGEDGLIVEKGLFKGLLLPQVPVEWKWNEEEFLSQCCIKAGLPPDCWLLKTARIYKFQALIFEEEQPKGEVKRKPLDRE